MAAIYRYNTAGSGVGSCDVCTDASGAEGTLDEIPDAPNPECRNPSDCNCSHEYLGEDDGCEQGECQCVDSEGFEYCGECGEDGCCETVNECDGCWCTTGIDPQTGDDDYECESPYWDPSCTCSDECDDRDEEGD